MHLSPRAIYRLEIARDLLGFPSIYAVLAYLDEITPDERERLKELADWVEEYERYKTSHQIGG